MLDSAKLSCKWGLWRIKQPNGAADDLLDRLGPGAPGGTANDQQCTTDSDRLAYGQQIRNLTSTVICRIKNKRQHLHRLLTVLATGLKQCQTHSVCTRM